jgi:hypothetical protein
MKISQRGQEKMLYSAEAIKKICLEAGADDVGLVDIDRGSLEKEREGILQVYSLARSVISIVVTNNRENLQSPARYVANEFESRRFLWEKAMSQSSFLGI